MLFEPAVTRNLADVVDEHSKKSLNVEAPAFNSPQPLAVPKASTFTSQVAAAASFTPRSGVVTPIPQQELEPEPLAFNPAESRDFIPGAVEYGLTQDVGDCVLPPTYITLDTPNSNIIIKTQLTSLKDNKWHFPRIPTLCRPIQYGSYCTCHERYTIYCFSRCQQYSYQWS